jgi:4-hydroxy-2-oxoheptanedioate aldolase
MVKDFPNEIRHRLHNGEVLFGVFCKTTSPEMIECLGYSGFDFCILDQEHGPIGMETLQNLVRAAEASNICPIVRVQEINELGISHPLDVGAAGVQVPQVNSFADAKRVIELSRFAPRGKRGVCRFVRAARFSGLDRNEYFSKANETIIILQLEGSAIDAYKEVVKLEDVDVFFIGPYDISQTLGMTGQIDAPEVQKKIKEIISIARTNGKAVGIFADTPEQVRRWIEAGCQYIAYSVDYGIFLDAARKLNMVLKECI